MQSFVKTGEGSIVAVGAVVAWRFVAQEDSTWGGGGAVVTELSLTIREHLGTVEDKTE